MINRILHYAFVLLITAGLSAGILSSVNKVTAPIIEEGKIEAINNARKKVFLEAEKFDENQKLVIGDLEFIPAIKEDNNVIGHVVEVKAIGYVGDITFVLGIDLSGEITGLDVIDSQETPGLGAKIHSEEWEGIWTGRNSSYKFDKQVDAFAGATISPEAVYVTTIETLNIYKTEVNSDEKFKK